MAPGRSGFDDKFVHGWGRILPARGRKRKRKGEGGDLKPEGETGNLVSGFKFQIQVSSSASFQNFHQAQANDVVEGDGASAEQRRGRGVEKPLHWIILAPARN